MYKVGVGHDVSLEELKAVDPQPRCEGMRCTRRSYAADGAVRDEGRYVELLFSMLPDATTYQSVLGQFGVKEQLTSAVTVYLRDETYTWGRYNGVAVRPEPGRDVKWRGQFPRDITILVKDLEAVAE